MVLISRSLSCSTLPNPFRRDLERSKRGGSCTCGQEVPAADCRTATVVVTPRVGRRLPFDENSQLDFCDFLLLTTSETLKHMGRGGWPWPAWRRARRGAQKGAPPNGKRALIIAYASLRVRSNRAARKLSVPAAPIMSRATRVRLRSSHLDRGAPTHPVVESTTHVVAARCAEEGASKRTDEHKSTLAIVHTLAARECPAMPASPRRS
jgi:hypothetical protein